MNIWNKVLVGLILLMALPFCYFATKALDLRKKAGDAIAKSEKELTTLTVDKEKLLRGPGSLAELRAEIFPYVTRRGRMWIGVVPKQFARDTGNVMVQTNAAPPKDAPGAVQLYVFQDSIPSQEKQEKPDTGEKPQKVEAAPVTPAGYLGEFTIANVSADGKTWQLAPVRPIPQERFARVEQGRGTWTIYETMPVPDPDLLARAAAPAATEPAADPAKAAEAPKKLTSAKDAGDYVATLVDYCWLFNELYATRTALLERDAAAKADLKSLTDSVAMEEQAGANLAKENESLTAELAVKEKQRDLVLAHQKAVDARFTEISGAVEELLKTNRQIAAEIARLQLEAARRIDQRVRGVVQTAAAR